MREKTVGVRVIINKVHAITVVLGYVVERDGGTKLTVVMDQLEARGTDVLQRNNTLTNHLNQMTSATQNRQRT